MAVQDPHTCQLSFQIFLTFALSFWTLPVEVPTVYLLNLEDGTTPVALATMATLFLKDRSFSFCVFRVFRSFHEERQNPSSWSLFQDHFLRSDTQRLASLGTLRVKCHWMLFNLRTRVLVNATLCCRYPHPYTVCSPGDDQPPLANRTNRATHWSFVLEVSFRTCISSMRRDKIPPPGVLSGPYYSYIELLSTEPPNRMAIRGLRLGTPSQLLVYQMGPYPHIFLTIIPMLVWTPLYIPHYIDYL